ncbi:MAG: GIY-YIG nuclease family protein [Terrimicrobiaceae bacterium]
MRKPSKLSRLPGEVAAIRKEIKSLLAMRDALGRAVGASKWGVYAFYDYDGEPIYIGQTRESLRSRIGRHLTNQRTDAVAMNVLDPFEVAEVELWPLDDLISRIPEAQRIEFLNRAEYTLYARVIEKSELHAVLNEKIPRPADSMELPASYRRRIIPENLYPQRKHPDVRMARRAFTIAALARVISERDVSDGLRLTLLTQARRLESLARTRVQDLAIGPQYRTTDEEV